MSYYISKDGLYLAIKTTRDEDYNWEPSEILGFSTTKAFWVKDPIDAKSFYDQTEATRYMLIHRYKDCQVVKVR